MTDIQQQLSTLLGRDVQQIRKTNEQPANISVIDVVQAITGMTKSNAGNYFDRVKRSNPEVSTNCRNYSFPGRGQRKTPVTDVRGLVELVLILPGARAKQIRRQAAELLVRYLGGDLALVDEICALRGLQHMSKLPNDRNSRVM